jgi:bacterioferritin
MSKETKKVIDLLNEARGRELSAILQYLYQHYDLENQDFGKLAKVLKATAISEMKHAEMLAERILFLGGTPTTKPTPITVGDNLKARIEQDIKDEQGAIELYTKIIELARKEGDEVTNLMFRHILEDEEDHHDTFTTLYEEV